MPGETENNEDWKQIRLPYHDREMYEPDDDNEVDPFDYLKFYKSLLSRKYSSSLATGDLAVNRAVFEAAFSLSN